MICPFREVTNVTVKENGSRRFEKGYSECYGNNCPFYIDRIDVNRHDFGICTKITNPHYRNIGGQNE